MSSGAIFTNNNRVDLPGAGRSMLFVDAAGDLILRDNAGVDVTLGASMVIPAGDRTLYVNAAAAAGGDGSVSTPFQTIAEAVAAIPAGDACTLYLAAGTYAENVTVSTSAITGLRITGQAPSAVSGVRITGTVTVGNSTTVMLEGIEIAGNVVLGDGFGGFATLRTENVLITGNLDGTGGDNCAVIAIPRGTGSRGLVVTGTVNLPSGGGDRLAYLIDCAFGSTTEVQWLVHAERCWFNGDVTVTNLGHVGKSRINPTATLTVNGDIWSANRQSESRGASGFYDCILSGVTLAGSAPIVMDAATLRSMQYDANGGGPAFPTPDPTTGCVIVDAEYENTSHLFGGHVSGFASVTSTGGGLTLSNSEGFDNLIVNAGDTLDLDGWPLFVRGHLILEAGAQIANRGAAAAGAAGGTWAGVSGPLKGGQGGDADPGFGVGTAGSNESPSRGGNGGVGGDGDNGAPVSGGAAGTVGDPLFLALPSPTMAMTNLMMAEGGGGGGGGGGDGIGVGGGGGYGGGPIYIFAKFLHMDATASIDASGGAGVNATGANAGGGGGGGGGSVYVAYAYGSLPGDVEALIDVTGGAGGTGNGLGATGTAGNAGTYKVTCLSVRS